MEKYKFDENNGLWYELQGDYYLPCLELPEKEQAYIGIWGQRHRRYLKEHRPTGGGSVRAAGKADGRARRCDRAAESSQFNGVGAEDE